MIMTMGETKGENANKRLKTVLRGFKSLFLHYHLYVFISNRQNTGNADKYVLFLSHTSFICIRTYVSKYVNFGVGGSQNIKRLFARHIAQ